MFIQFFVICYLLLLLKTRVQRAGCIKSWFLQTCLTSFWRRRNIFEIINFQTKCSTFWCMSPTKLLHIWIHGLKWVQGWFVLLYTVYAKPVLDSNCLDHLQSILNGIIQLGPKMGLVPGVLGYQMFSIN